MYKKISCLVLFTVVFLFNLSQLLFAEECGNCAHEVNPDDFSCSMCTKLNSIDSGLSIQIQKFPTSHEKFIHSQIISMLEDLKKQQKDFDTQFLDESTESATQTEQTDTNAESGKEVAAHGLKRYTSYQSNLPSEVSVDRPKCDICIHEKDEENSIYCQCTYLKRIDPNLVVHLKELKIPAQKCIYAHMLVKLGSITDELTDTANKLKRLNIGTDDEIDQPSTSTPNQSLPSIIEEDDQN